jgi:hypothetical protein
MSSTNNPNIPTRSDFIQQFGYIQGPDGRSVINSVKPSVLSRDTLYVHKNLYVYGPISPAPSFDTLSLSNGTSGGPSLSFISNSSTGIYYDPSTSGVGISSNGITQLLVGSTSIQVNEPITTSSGNLVLNPSGASIDFTGHTLINVAGISTNPNFYQIIAPSTVQTTDSTPTTIYDIPTVTNATYTIQTSIALTDETDSTSSGSFIINTKVKNIGGTLTIISIDSTEALDTSIASSTVSFITSGVNVNVTANGVSAITIKWFGASTITRQLF